MFSAFPWMGIGQGEFYRQSSNEGFSHSFLLSAWGGENAHNYFLQTLAETGLIGVAVFSFALLAPLFLSPKKSDLRVGLIALGSLFLGNLYSHAFLVRENLLLGALFLALLYSYIPSVSLSSGGSQIRPPKSPISNKAILCLIISIGCMTSFGVYEVYKSFGKEPFRFGSECFVNRPLTKDSWTSGLFMVRMPKGSSGVVVSLEPIRSDISAERPLRYGAEIVNRRIETISSVKGEWNSSNKVELRIARPLDSADTSPREDSFILNLGGCFVPRNLGVSLDDRLLGVRILSISHY
jgi:O-antigen ligase